MNHSHNRSAALLWIGKTYADLGFFADAAKALGELCSSFNDPDARRLLTEVIWWRDNAHRLPWLPPAGDGSRYDHMMQFVDPSAPIAWETVRKIRAEHQRERREAYRPAISPQLSGLFSLPAFPPDPAPTLDRDDRQPGEPADWAKQQARLFRGKIGKQILLDRRWTRNILPPSNPKRYNPNEAPFTPEL